MRIFYLPNSGVPDSERTFLLTESFDGDYYTPSVPDPGPSSGGSLGLTALHCLLKCLRFIG